jgi:hypothetical protein
MAYNNNMAIERKFCLATGLMGISDELLPLGMRNLV